MEIWPLWKNFQSYPSGKSRTKKRPLEHTHAEKKSKNEHLLIHSRPPTYMGGKNPIKDYRITQERKLLDSQAIPQTGCDGMDPKKGFNEGNNERLMKRLQINQN